MIGIGAGKLLVRTASFVDIAFLSAIDNRALHEKIS